jgi:uncharacterized membrane protein (UPF0136 family)
MTSRGWRRAFAGAAAGLLGSLLITSSVFADPPGPTDYQSEVVSVEPPASTVTASIIGGDSFFQLSVAAGTDVVVLGYQGEQMIWFRPDSTVWENRNSPSVYLNGSRLGGGGIPANATADAAPDWKQVAADGNFSWHDHRAHWMQEARPFGLGPGDQILESVIPLLVDDAQVDVTVISTWKPAPSPLPAVAGFAAGLALAVAAWFLHRSRRFGAALAVTLPVALLALVVGMWQFRSLPPETGPKLVWWVLPMVATFSVAVGIIAAKRAKTFVADAAMLLVGVELAIWGFVKRDGLSAAIIPTDAPDALDRFATAMALGGGVAFAALALWWLFRPLSVSDSREPTGSPRPAHP